MDRINIDNLFSTVPDRKPLDVYSLYNTQETRVVNKIRFNVDKLINAKEEKRQQARQQYRKIYNICLNKIDIANSIHRADIIYDVPLFVHRCDEYNSLDCLNYLQDKLRDMYIDTLIVPPSAIFISWADIEINKKQQQQDSSSPSKPSY